MKLHNHVERRNGLPHRVEDGEPCRFCGKPIFWDEWCFIHANGWAECAVKVTPTHPVPWVPTDEDIEQLGEDIAAALSSNERILINPEITSTRPRHHRALPRLYVGGWK